MKEMYEPGRKCERVGYKLRRWKRERERERERERKRERELEQV